MGPMHFNPEHAHRHHSLRAAAAVVAALAGGLALTIAGFATIGGSATTAAWVTIAVLSAVWLSGLWWRWDAPDRRRAELERERRMF